jgi:hypothetical protein
MKFRLTINGVPFGKEMSRAKAVRYVVQNRHTVLGLYFKGVKR